MITDALRAGARRLEGVSPTPRLDVELLMAHAIGISREKLLLGVHGANVVPPAFAALLDRRAAHEPIAYIAGHRAFWTIGLDVTPDVLIPRADSETLIEGAIAHFEAPGPRRVLDLGTGSGALLLAALAQWPGVEGVGIDRSERALTVAAANAKRLGLADRARFCPGDWSWAADGGFDLVLCNPPYIADHEILPPDVARYEPAEALYAGTDGLDAYRALAPLLRLPPGGLACFEIGVTQGSAVTALLAAAGFAASIKPDLAGRDRCVLAVPRVNPLGFPAARL